MTAHVTPGRKTRYVGTCQICEHRQKLVRRKGAPETLELVHHGYQRPGDGAILGDCFGVRYEPYETATDGCADYQRYAHDRQLFLAEHLKKLEAGEIRTLSIQVLTGLGFGRREYTWRTVSADAESAEERLKFSDELESFINRTKAEIGGWKHVEERMVARIAAWPPKTKIVTFEEYAEEVAAERRRRSEEVKAERAARNAPRIAKQIALAEKRARWEAEKQELMTKYRELFLKLASELPQPAGVARSNWTIMYARKGKKAYLQFYPGDLGCDDALVKLGLAKNGSHGIVYATAYGAL